MIKQKFVVIKTISATLTYSEMGDIVCNSTVDITITLPTPNSGLWHRISNVGAGIVTVYYGSTLTTLKQTEQCLCLANASTSWFFSKGGGAMTKLEIEDVLTGEISSHSHAPIYELPIGGTAGQILTKNSITDRDVVWEDVSGGGLIINPNHIFVDNITRDNYFITNPTEKVTGIYISVGTGFQQWDGTTWLDKTAVVTGLPGIDGVGVPIGGTAGQILSKIDGIDNNTEWVTPSSGGGGLVNTTYGLQFAASTMEEGANQSAITGSSYTSISSNTIGIMKAMRLTEVKVDLKAGTYNLWIDKVSQGQITLASDTLSASFLLGVPVVLSVGVHRFEIIRTVAAPWYYKSTAYAGATWYETDMSFNVGSPGAYSIPMRLVAYLGTWEVVS